MRSRAIEAIQRSLKLTRVQREVLVGILLGDACLESLDRGRTYRLKVEQSARHEAYLRHLYQLFHDWVLTEPRLRRGFASNHVETASWAFSTVSHQAFRFYAHQFYAGGKKQVPKLIHRWLTPRGLAYWFMDDGSIKSSQSKGVIFNTQGFEPVGVERLVIVLHEQFGLKASMRHQRDGQQIYISGFTNHQFMKLVDSHILPEMRYKLPKARRTLMPKK